MSRHIKREKTSLPADVRRSKTSLLKLPNISRWRCVTTEVLLKIIVRALKNGSKSKKRSCSDDRNIKFKKCLIEWNQWKCQVWSLKQRAWHGLDLPGCSSLDWGLMRNAFGKRGVQFSLTQGTRRNWLSLCYVIILPWASKLVNTVADSAFPHIPNS